MIKTTAEAHGFSAWKGLATIVLGTFVLLAPIFLIALLVGGLRA